jgi:hypothetical protein
MGLKPSIKTNAAVHNQCRRWVKIRSYRTATAMAASTSKSGHNATGITCVDDQRGV